MCVARGDGGLALIRFGRQQGRLPVVRHGEARARLEDVFEALDVRVAGETRNLLDREG